MNIADVDFPDPLLTALRDGRLVVFAGAGISMGHPANLPGFRELARQIADGTGFALGDSEPEDQFLGRVKDAGPDVHQRAAQLLQQNDPAPTELHRNLLRLYANGEDVRIVTTNFDLLFEQAANHLFTPPPKVFQAPALPLGQRFQSMVHIHGSVNEPMEMVLTSQDFGRAYLTESDGWARRFLVDLFANFTVLFIGYSHSDTIMTYLTPSLPRHDNDLRYALIGDLSDDPRRWLALGIQPITFHQADENDFVGLDNAINGLAHHLRRGILDWQRKITAIASEPPGTDEESASIIEHALSIPALTHFFTAAAKSPEWIEWLDHRKCLAPLFTEGILSEKDRMLAFWLASSFMTTNSDELLLAIERNNSKLNPYFWNQLSWQIHDSIKNPPDPEPFSRWVVFLTCASPPDADGHTLLWLAESCTSVGLLDCLLQIYEAMTANLNRKLTRSSWNDSEVGHYEVQTLWEGCLKPNLAEVAESLLWRTTMKLEDRYSMLKALWDATRNWDSDSSHRSAIEPHQQDDYPQDIDALIDIARECLEWLSVHQADTVRLWSERYIRSQAPLLRRLAVHSLSVRTDLAENGKIAWVLEHGDMHDIAVHHEVFRVMGIGYSRASLEQREAVIEAVLGYRWPDEDDPEKELRTAHHRFRWLHWLQSAAPDCSLTKQSLGDILALYPDFQAPEHPDLTHYWSGFERVAGETSPWRVPDILAQPPADWLHQALEQDPSEHPLHPRHQLIDTVEEAVKENLSWGLDLADEMVQAKAWDTHIWRGVITGWRAAELDETSLFKVTQFLSLAELYAEHAAEITDALSELIGKNQSVVNPITLHLANDAARKLWQYVAIEDRMPNSEWLTRAINHPAGDLAQYWTHSIAIWRSHQETAPDALNSEYLNALSEIMGNFELPGILARVVLTSQVSLLAFIDEGWTKENLIPLLYHEHPEFMSAWEGLTYCRPMTPRTAGVLCEPFLNAVEHISNSSPGSLLHRFITKYTQLLTWFVNNPTDGWIINLFSSSNGEARHIFARQIAFVLRSLDEAVQVEWWNAWLNGYWKNRLQGAPLPLDETEVETMIEWTLRLTAVYPEAVDLAVQMPPIPLRRGIIFHDLQESDLLDKYPESVAELLMHLSKAEDTTFMRYGTREIIDRLLLHTLKPETETGLQEVIARVGLG